MARVFLHRARYTHTVRDRPMSRGLVVVIRPCRTSVGRSRGGCRAQQKLPAGVVFFVVGGPGPTRRGVGTQHSWKLDCRMPEGSRAECETHAWLPQAHSRDWAHAATLRWSCAPGLLSTSVCTRIRTCPCPKETVRTMKLLPRTLVLMLCCGACAWTLR